MKKIFILLSLVGTMMASCKKESLDLQNPNAPSPQEFFVTDADAKSAANSVYNTLYYDGVYWRWTVLGQNFRSDELYASGPWGLMIETGNFTMNSGGNGENINKPYQQHYIGIFRANQVIEGLTGKTTMAQTARDQALGQAYFLRGLYYFNLLNMFRNVPLVTTTAKSSEEYTQPIAIPEKVWAQIEDDWKKAGELLPATWPGSEAGRVTKGAAIAFLAKAYLWQKKYAEAKSEFEKIIDKSAYGYDLMPNYGDNFNETAPANNKESIFEIQWSTKVGGATFGGMNTTPNVNAMLSSNWAAITAAIGYGYGDAKVRPWLLAEFQKEKTVANQDDPRLDLTLWYNKPGATYYNAPWTEALTAAHQNSVYVKKYHLWRTKSGRNAALDHKNAMPYYVMRYADVLLMYAESLNELGQTAASYAPIKRVRDRVQLADLAVVKPNLTQQQMRDQIAHERTTELATEGVRFDDIRRWGWLGDPAKLAQLKANDTEFNTYLPGREYYPQPQRMLDVARYPQNAGY